MHEIGILYTAADTVTKYAESNDLKSVQTIRLELGELAGVIPNVFTDYFDYVKAQYPILKDAELQLKLVPGEGLCDDCGCLYNVMKQEGKCPACGSRRKTVVSGQEVRLVSIS